MVNTTRLLPTYGGFPRGVMVKMLDCGIVLSEFELQSLYYVHFRTNALGKGMKPLILSAMSLNNTATVFLEEWL